MNLRILDRPIAFQRIFVDLTGSITGALLLSQAVYWQLRCQSEDGWWWKTNDDWAEEIGLSRTELETARKACRKFLRHEVRGVPAKSFYHVDVQALETEIASLQESRKPVCRNPASQFAGIQQTRLPESRNLLTTETTSEITSENTSAVGAGNTEQCPANGVDYLRRTDLKPRKKPKATDLFSLPIPEVLNTPAFLEAWTRWQQHRRERRCPLTPTCAAAQLKKLAAFGPAAAVATINRSIENGWQGLFPEKPAHFGTSYAQSTTPKPRPINGNL